MSVMSAGCPSCAGSAAVETLRSTFERSLAKRVRISHGRSLCPSISGVCARIRAMRCASESAASAGGASGSAKHRASARQARHDRCGMQQVLRGDGCGPRSYCQTAQHSLEPMQPGGSWQSRDEGVLELGDQVVYVLDANRKSDEA